MLIARPSDIPSSEITPRDVYLRRREFWPGAAGLGLAALSAAGRGARRCRRKEPALAPTSRSRRSRTSPLQQLLRVRHRQGRSGQTPHTLKTSPGPSRSTAWSASRPTIALEDLIKPVALEERIYRMRCVEGWSMVIPWVGFPLADAAQARRAARQRQVRRLRDAGAAGGDAGPARLVPAAAVALRRGPAARRGDASADHPGRRPLRRDAAQPERRADPAGRAVEVRLQEHQVDRAHHA